LNAPDCVVLDFETYPIFQRPEYPPRPVGCAFKWPREQSYYMAFGHPTGNNCTAADMMAELDRAWSSGLPMLFHNAKFDLGVACEGGDFQMPAWDRVHDTMFLAYLCDPHAPKLGLKELAADLLSWPPDERDAVAEWVMTHSEALLQAYPWNREKGKPNPRGITKSKVGAWIFAAPGDVVGPYACGDVDRTEGLFEHLWPIVQENGMAEAYDRERHILPIFMGNEQRGMRVDLEILDRDIFDYSGMFDWSEEWLRRELHASGLNFDADQDVAAVLMSRGIVPEHMWVRTKASKTHPNGQVSMSKDNLLPEYFTDPRIASALGYRNRLKTCLDMFMRPWSLQANKRGGYMSTNWNQVRGAGDAGGTRTGRPSTQDPNLLNISKDFAGRDDGYVHPDFLQVELLPLCRRYIMPDEGEVFLHRDFDGQELRIFAHGEQGDLWEQYQANPALDPHAFIGEELMRVAGRMIERTKVKTLNFQGIYGGGVPALQRKLRCTLAEAKELKAFHNNALPGRKLVNEEITRIMRRGDPIRTIGGRLYYPERPGPDGRDKIYKLLNYWVQGSAADLTKQSIIDWYEHPLRTARFLVTVYDEVDVSVDKVQLEVQNKLLRDEMERPRLGLSVPMRSSGKAGPCWGKLSKIE
jgi:DNA polymerase I-like protein with 3'-5' exonuclease and polymerase domains